jgi:hypothetical protein
MAYLVLSYFFVITVPHKPPNIRKNTGHEIWVDFTINFISNVSQRKKNIFS